MRFIGLVILVGLMCLVGSVSAATYPLYAGQTNEVGYIEVTEANGELTVDYYITAPNYLSESHWTFLNQMPTETTVVSAKGKGKAGISSLTENLWYLHDWMTKTGNPKVGHFPWEDGESANYDDLINAHAPASIELGDTLFVAAHGVVQICTYDDLDLSSSAVMCIAPSQYPPTNDGRRDTVGIASYFDVYFTGEDGGDIIFTVDTADPYWYDAWCADEAVPIASDRCYSVAFSRLDNPCVDFILNNIEYLYSRGATWSEIQAVMWYYIDGFAGPYPGSVDPYLDTGLVRNIIAWADREDCCNYVRDCNDLTAVVAYGEDIQPVIVGVPVPCTCTGETCWAANGEPLEIQFPGNNWATFVQFDRPDD